MGFMDRLGLTRASRIERAAHRLGIVSPYSTAEPLPQLIVTDLLTEEQQASLPLTRDLALTIPAVSKARNLLVSTIAKFPLRELDKSGPVTEQSSFLYRSDSAVSPYERMLWTVDDAIFYGVALWTVNRGERARDERRPILDAEWVPFGDWTIHDGRVYVYDEPARKGEVILFNFPFEGLLHVGRTTLQGARSIESAWVDRARNPIPVIELHMIDDQLSQKEADDYRREWAKARRAKDGAIGLTPPSMELKTHGELKPELYTEGRNAIRTDVGSHLNVRASMLDGTTGVDSLTYTTKDGERNLFYELDLPFWTGTIEQRLSMDDVVSRGHRVRFDKYELYNPPAPTGPIMED